MLTSKKQSLGKTVVITGASSGIGRALVAVYTLQGWKVVLASRHLEALMSVQQELELGANQALCVQTDVRNENECKRLIEKTYTQFGRLDLLINNAGHGHYATIEELRTNDLDLIFKTNLYGPLWCSQAALPIFKKQGYGHIANVSSMISFRSVPTMSAYCMTKFALNALDEAMRIELGPFNVDVTLIAPGLTLTNFQSSAATKNRKAPISNQKGMSAQKVAQKIFAGLERRKSRIYFTWEGIALHVLQRISPSLVDKIMALYFRRFANAQREFHV